MLTRLIKLKIYIIFGLISYEGKTRTATHVTMYLGLRTVSSIVSSQNVSKRLRFMA